MSVILDALRRARAGAPARPPSPASSRPAGIPAGLRIGGTANQQPPRSGGRTRWGLIAGVVVAGAAVWAGMNFGLPLLQRQAAAPVVVAITDPLASAPLAPDASAPTAPVADPVSAVDPSADVPETQPELDERPSSAPVIARGSRPARPAALPRPPLPAAPAPALTSSAVVAAPPVPAVNHFDLAVRYQSLGNFEQALAHYSAVLQSQEFNVEARNNLGLLYLDRGLTAEAIDQFKRAILINPEYLKARGNLAVVLMNAGRLDEARAELRAALAISPRNVDLLVNMALVDKTARQPEQAKETLLRALGYQPSHAAAHYNLAVLYDEAGDVAQAYDQYNDFLKNAGPEYGARLSDVRRRVEAIAPKLDAIR